MSTIDGGYERRPYPARRHVLASVVRTALVIVVSSCLYALAPLGRRVDGDVAVQLAGWLLVFAVVFAWQLRAVIRSSYPVLRAGEAIAVSVTVLILLFASAYVVAGRMNPASFTEPLSRVDALYFAVTIFATVGFGDISPRSDDARILVTMQMLADLVLIGVIAKILVGAVHHRRQTLDARSVEHKVD